MLQSTLYYEFQKTICNFSLTKNKFISFYNKKFKKEMKQKMKESSQSFLEKFKGKSTKISKHGISHLLQQKVQPVNKQLQYKSLDSSRQIQPAYPDTAFDKLAPQAQNQKAIQAKRLAIDMQELFSSNPQFGKNKKVILKKLSNVNPPQLPVSLQNIPSNNFDRKQRFLPPLYTPQKNYKRTVSSTNKTFNDSVDNLKTDSENISISSQKKSKYKFGKYLKLDQDAMKHLQFLRNIQQKGIFRESNKQKILSR